MLVSTGQGRRIHLASKIPCYLLSYLSICHSQNYGVKTRKFHGRGKDQLPVYSTKRYFKPRSVCLPYGTIHGNRNMFPFPTNKSSNSNHGLHINPNSTTDYYVNWIPVSLLSTISCVESKYVSLHHSHLVPKLKGSHWNGFSSLLLHRMPISKQSPLHISLATRVISIEL